MPAPREGRSAARAGAGICSSPVPRRRSRRSAPGSSASGVSSRGSPSSPTASALGAATRCGRRLRDRATPDPRGNRDGGDGMNEREARTAADEYLNETAATVLGVRGSCLDDVVAAAELSVTSLRAGGKLLICGNGGSAADAQ